MRGPVFPRIYSRSSVSPIIQQGPPGGGLGLFLVVNVARTLGGAVTAHNLPQGGAVVRLTLPVSAIEIKSETQQHDY
jgi:two-component system sensor histidine kinase RegB